jgi:hypothetical protein
MALRDDVARSDVCIEKWWLGFGRGNLLRLIHVPTGITIVGEPIGVHDSDGFSRETARLMEELKRKLADSGNDVEAI